MRSMYADILAGLLAGWQTFRTRRYWRRRGINNLDLPF